MTTNDRTTVNQFAALLRNDFCGFIHRSFVELNPSAEFLPNWHIEAMAAALDMVRRGENHRLIINLPPRHLKTHAATIAFTAWLLGHNPSAQIISVSYAQEAVEKPARACRKLMVSPFYKALFKTRISEDRQAIADFETTVGGNRFSTSVGGVLTGRGADVIVIDDPLKSDDAPSETRRKAVNEWYDNTLYSRLNNKETGAIVLIMQRLHENDLVAHVLAHEDWDVVSFPALAPENVGFKFKTVFGWREVQRREGEVLHPEGESLETLSRTRRVKGEANFQAQYQQSPMPDSGVYIKPEWLRDYVPSDLPSAFDYLVQSWDTANSESEFADFSVCTTWGISGEHFYLVNVFRQRIGFPRLKQEVKALALHAGPSVVLIEEDSYGAPLCQDLGHEGFPVPVMAMRAKGDKVGRLMKQIARFEGGFVHIPKAANWRDPYVAELTSFPNELLPVW